MAARPFSSFSRYYGRPSKRARRSSGTVTRSLLLRPPPAPRLTSQARERPFRSSYGLSLCILAEARFYLVIAVFLWAHRQWEPETKQPETEHEPQWPANEEDGKT